MEVKNLLGKLHANEGEGAAVQPKVPTPPIPRPIARGPKIEDRVQPGRAAPVATGGRNIMTNDTEEGIILDLGEGLSLNIPIQRRMSLSDFIKLAEKVKALEMLSEHPEHHEHM